MKLIDELNSKIQEHLEAIGRLELQRAEFLKDKVVTVTRTVKYTWQWPYDEEPVDTHNIKAIMHELCEPEADKDETIEETWSIA